MQSALLLLALIAQSEKPFDFTEKPVVVKVDKRDGEIEGLRKQLADLEQVKDESDARKKQVLQLEDKIAELQQLKDEHAKVAQVAGAAVESNTDEIKRLRVELAGSKAEVIILKKDLAEAREKAFVASTAEDIPAINIAGFFAAAQPIARSTQIVLTSSDKCSHCGPFITALSNSLGPKWSVSEDPSAMIWIEKITDAEWNRRGYSLPHLEMRSRGKSEEIVSRDPNVIAAKYNAAIAKETSLPPSMEEPIVGAVVTHVNAKQQVMQLLTLMEPFLDGGTIELSYTSKPGVVKEFLTIKQGPASIRIPPKTTIKLSMKGGDLTVLFVDPRVHVVVGPLERGIQEIDITPNKISVRLPWMIDPEIGLK